MRSLSLTSSGQSTVIFLDRAAIFLRRRPFIAQAQISSTTLLLHLPAQLQFELTQGFNHVRLQVRGRCRITVHRAVGEFPELFDHIVEPAGAPSGRAPFASQVLRFTQPLAYLRGQLPVITPTVACASAVINATTFPGPQRLTAILRTARPLSITLLLTLLPAALRTLLPFLSLLTALTLLTALALLTSLALLPLLSFLSLLLSLLLPLPLLLPPRVLIQTPAQRIEIVS
jgi:hypothetical protein